MQEIKFEIKSDFSSENIIGTPNVLHVTCHPPSRTKVMSLSQLKRVEELLWIPITDSNTPMSRNPRRK